MKIKLSVPLLLPFCLVALATSVALADVPPPDDYVEQCTKEIQTKPGLECQECNAWHGEREVCKSKLEKDGFRKMCQSWGASAWTEVWCKGEAKPEPAKESTTKSSCAGGGLEALSLLGLLALVRRRGLRL